MTAAETAELLRISARTLEGWRALGKGPTSRKCGRRVVYARGDVLAWLQSQETRGAGETKPDPLKEAEAVTAWPYKPAPHRYQVSMPYTHPITGAEVRVRKLAPADRTTIAAAIKWGEAERLRIVSDIVRDPKPKEGPKTEPQPKAKPTAKAAKAPTLADFWPTFEAGHIAKLKRSSRVSYGQCPAIC